MYMYMYMYMNVYVSSDLEVLVDDYVKADIACPLRGSRKFRDDICERKNAVS